jgi:hypothetical protein
MDLFAADDAVLLSTQISVSTCGKPRSAKMFWNMHALFALRNREAYSYSAVDERTLGMILD